MLVNKLFMSQIYIHALPYSKFSARHLHEIAVSCDEIVVFTHLFLNTKRIPYNLHNLSKLLAI